VTPTETRKDEPLIRNLRPRDLEAVIALDAKITGRRRDEYFRVKLDQAMKETGIIVSLAAEVGGAFAGFLIGRVFYGEFGRMEAAAVLDTIGVDPSFRRAGVGRALVSQLRTNLLGLGIPSLHTEVAWDDLGLMGFFHGEGFRPAPRFCLDLDLEGHRDRSAAEEQEAEDREAAGA
jgi:ribosomal protein S18 acetylase RimI-like enzyme